MRFLLEQAKVQVSAGVEAQQKGHFKAARRHYLQAAEYLFQVAAKSQGNLKAIRTQQAEEFFHWAQALHPVVAGQEKSSTAQVATSAGEKEDVPWLIHERPALCLQDVAGLDHVKEQIRLKLIYPFTHPDLARRFGVAAGGGVLLYGPPGTGKTMMARAIAGEVDAAFFAVKPAEIMSKWVGKAEQNIQKLFTVARQFSRSVIFIDEIEALIPKRRGNRSTVMKRVVPQILSELEGFHQDKTGALLFVGATNEPWSLDPAVLRPGRFDEKIYVALPDLPARRRILELNLAERPLASDLQIEELAEQMGGYSGADIVNICRKACAIPFLEGVQNGAARDVSWIDFQTVLADTKPSVSKKELQKYERYQGE